MAHEAVGDFKVLFLLSRDATNQAFVFLLQPFFNRSFRARLNAFVRKKN